MLLVALLICCAGGVVAFPAAVLGAAMLVCSGERLGPLSAGFLAFAGLALCSIPAAAWLAGVMLDSFALPLKNGRFFAPAATILAAWLILSSDAPLLAIGALSRATHAPDLIVPSLQLLGSMVATASLSALILVTAPLLLEFPVHWALDRTRIELRPVLQPVRPLLILAILSIGFRLFIDLFAQGISL